MYNLGVVQLGTIYIPMPSRDVSGAGTAFSATLEPADFDIHKNGSTGALTISTGTITINETVGSIAGKNLVSIDLSNDTDFTAGAHYQVWLTPNDETLDSQVVAECIAVFQTETNAQKAIRTFNEAVYKTDVVVNSTANTTTVVDLQDFLDAQAPNDSTIGMLYAWEDSTGELEYFRVQSMTSLKATVEAWPAGGALSAAVAVNDKLWPVQHVDINVTAISDDITAANNAESFFDGTGYAGTGNTIPTVTTLTGHTPQTGDSFARLGAPAGASVSADIATVDANVDAILVDTAEIGVAGAGLTAVPWNAAWDAEVQSEVTDALVAANLDHVALTATTTAVGVGTYLGRIMNASTSGTYDRTTDSLEAIRNNNPTNFSALAITTGGAVTAGTVSDKTGYSLSQSFPTNFGSLTISTGGNVTAGTVSDKTGYSLAVTGLDSVTLSEPSAVPVWGTVTAREGIAWNVAFNRNKIISNSTEITLRNDADAADIAAAPVTATTSSVTRGEYA